MSYAPNSQVSWQPKVGERKKSRQIKDLLTQAVTPGVLKIDRHHLTNKCEGGGGKGKDKTLRMKVERHRALHRHFGNLRWETIADLLYSGRFRRLRMFINLEQAEIGNTLHTIFHRRDPRKCVAVMDRVTRIKKRTTSQVKLRLAA